jgi:hypothetical protein
MLQDLSPCHYHYFGFLHRRYRTVAALAQHITVPASLQSAISALGRGLPQHKSLGIRTPLALDEVLDDTSTESFLNTLDDRIAALEANVYPLLSALSEESFNEVLAAAGLWGRRVGQEALMADGGPKLKTGHLEGVWTLATLYLGGGDWARPPFLLRRATTTDLSYLALGCPHRKQSAMDAHSQDLACSVEAALYRGFYETLCPGYSFSRSRREGSCADFISNQR